MLHEFTFLVSLLAAISIGTNVALIWFIRKTFSRFYTASEEASEIFSRLDAFKEHLQTVYELPTFYGDQTLQNLLEHNKEVLEFIKKYDDVYSFTQPDLEQQLLAASEDYDDEEENNEEEAPQAQIQ